MTQRRADEDTARAEASYPGTPRWVKIFAVATIAVVVAVLLIVVVSTALGLHTPPAGGHGP